MLQKTLPECIQQQSAWDTFMADETRPFQELRVRYDGEFKLTDAIDDRPRAVRIDHRLSDHAMGQLCSRHSIPRAHWEHVAASNDDMVKLSWATHLNAVLMSGYGKKTREDGEMLIRLYTGGPEGSFVRAILTDRFARFDNMRLLVGAQRAVDYMDTKGIEFKLWQVSQSMDRIALRFYAPGVAVDDGVRLTRPEQYNFSGISGQKLHPGVSMRTAGDGSSSLVVDPFLASSACTNGLIFGMDSEGGGIHQRHVGRTERMLDTVFNAAVADSFVRSNEHLNEFMSLQGMVVTDPLDEIVKIVKAAKGKPGMTDQLADMAKGALPTYAAYGPTMYSVVNAMTQAAQQLDDGDQVAVETFLGSLVHDLATSRG